MLVDLGNGPDLNNEAGAKLLSRYVGCFMYMTIVSDECSFRRWVILRGVKVIGRLNQVHLECTIFTSSPIFRKRSSGKVRDIPLYDCRRITVRCKPEEVEAADG